MYYLYPEDYDDDDDDEDYDNDDEYVSGNNQDPVMFFC